MNPDQLFEYLIATDQIDDVLGTKEIIFYLNGKVKERLALTFDNASRTNGMKVKVHLSNGNKVIGYSFFEYEQDERSVYVGIGLTEKKEFDLVEIPFKDIIKIEAILYSNPRWGVKENFESFEI
ncbi:MAG TPA: hypothetical protein GX708_01500 [Gallicola sp.]|nr:hypothetical protein [Gallicola sp.]